MRKLSTEAVRRFGRTAACAITLSLAMPAALVAAQEPTPGAIPAEAFAALPKVRQLTQSPDGSKVAFLSELDGRPIMVVQNLDGSGRAVQPPIEEADIFDYRWANNGRLLVMYEFFGTSRQQPQLFERLNTNRQFYAFKGRETRLAAVNADGTGFEWIIQSSKIDSGSSAFGDNLALPRLQTNIIDMLPGEPDHILVAIDGDANFDYEVRKVDIRDGTFVDLHRGRKNVQNWMTDSTGELRYAWGANASGNPVAYWKDAGGSWVNIADRDWYQRYEIIGVGEAPDQFIATGPTEHGTRGLMRLQSPSGTVLEELFSHADYDVSGFVLTEDRTSVATAQYIADSQEAHHIDTRRDGLYRAMSRALPGYQIEIVDLNHDAGRYLLLASNDREQGLYLQYDRQSRQLNQVSPMRPDLEPDLMAPTRRMEVTARDGTMIATYLTTPLGATEEKLPAVVLVQDEPAQRVDARWDYWTQFLASRGYAVLKVNYRGTAGFGSAHQSAGDAQFGGLMQQDVTDATRQLIEAGIFDAKRVCIAGASYGGYAALMGLVQASELYACGLAVNGVVNVPGQKGGDDVRRRGDDGWIATMGLAGADDNDISPYHQATRINDPVLLVTAKDDGLLPWTDAESFHERLRSMGKDSTFVVTEDGGHELKTAQSRLAMLQAAEAFLKEHIGD